MMSRKLPPIKYTLCCRRFDFEPQCIRQTAPWDAPALCGKLVDKNLTGRITEQELDFACDVCAQRYAEERDRDKSD